MAYRGLNATELGTRPCVPLQVRHEAPRAVGALGDDVFSGNTIATYSPAKGRGDREAVSAKVDGWEADGQDSSTGGTRHGMGRPDSGWEFSVCWVRERRPPIAG